MTWKRLGTGLMAPTAAVVFGLGISALALLAIGTNPVEAFGSMASYGWRLDSMVAVSNRAVPLYFSALAVAIGFKMKLFNIGVEGQYRLAVIIAAWAGAVVVLPPVLHVLLIVVVAMAVGAVWSGTAGVLKVRRGVHEVISTIMLNFIATGLGAWLLANYLREPPAPGDLIIKTAELPPSGRVPSLSPALRSLGIEVPQAADLQGFVLAAVVVGILYWFVVWRTRFGYDLRASGINPGAAQASGVDADAMVVKTMLISGALAGLVGLSPLLGFFHRYTLDFPTGLGFAGIAVALLGRNHPVGMALGALLFGFLERSSQILDLRGVPKEVVTIMQGVIILAVVVAYEVAQRIVQAQQVQAAAEELTVGEREKAEAAA